MHRIAAAALAVTLFACAGPKDDASPPDAEDRDDTTAELAPPQIEFLRSAWQVRGPDGMLYITYLDEDGTYRDLANGEVSQTGTWTEGREGGVCFTPDAEGAATDCWIFGRSDKNGTMLATMGEEQVELRRVAYEEKAD